MDPKDRQTILEQAKVTGLFDTDLLPDADGVDSSIDTLQVVETAAGALLILTAGEAHTYAEVAGATNVMGEELEHEANVARAIERLGRLRAVHLERFDAPPTPVELRDKLLKELAWFIERNGLDGREPEEDGYGHPTERVFGYAAATQSVANLVGAVRDLEPNFATGLALEPITGHIGPVLDEVTGRRVAGHVYQRVQGSAPGSPSLGGALHYAEVARDAVLEAFRELGEEG